MLPQECIILMRGKDSAIRFKASLLEFLCCQDFAKQRGWGTLSVRRSPREICAGPATASRVQELALGGSRAPLYF
jgi:hypothetical protein